MIHPKTVPQDKASKSLMYLNIIVLINYQHIVILDSQKYTSGWQYYFFLLYLCVLAPFASGKSVEIKRISTLKQRIRDNYHEDE